MKLKMIFLTFSIFATVILAPKTAQATKAKSGKEELSTNVEFDPMTIHGRYQYAAEGKVQVEEEKVLFDLLGPRKNFKDRMKQMAKQK